MKLINIDSENEELTIEVSVPFTLRLSFAEANELKERLRKNSAHPFKGIKKFPITCEKERIRTTDRDILLNEILSQVPNVSND